ncbi:MAG: NAD(P)H-dependent oxidoreductase [Christensenellaceae bacterium]|nr:NAD(P)H-dependent oxidoreductase [Christensenellaceae bacterium]
MKTLLINCSPKKSLSASSYLAALQSLFLKGDKVIKKLRLKNDYAPIFEELKDADSVVLCLPLYVDGVPSHVLAFLEEAEKFFLENNLHTNLYCIANNGFIEGRQNEPLMQVLENFCLRAGINWCGGVGIGGGVMLNVTRIVFAIQIVMYLTRYIINGIQTGVFWGTGYLSPILQNVGVLLFFNAGVLFFLIRMGIAINNGSFFGKQYTRIMIPSFIFVPMASVFFFVISFFQGGLFRGWLAKK